MLERLRRLRSIAVILAIVAILAIAWVQMRNLRSHGSDAAASAAVGVTIYRGSQGVPLPQVRSKTIDGASLSLADLRGHVVVLNVWGSWCAPCRAEAPDLSKISRETAPQGVRFVGINVRDNPAAARAFTRTYHIPYPSLDDQDGLVLAQFTGIIPVSAVPSTLVVDKAGVIRARVVGKVDTRTLRGLIQDTLELT